MLPDEPPLPLVEADDWARTGDGVELEATEADDEVCE